MAWTPFSASDTGPSTEDTAWFSSDNDKVAYFEERAALAAEQSHNTPN